MKPHPTDTQLRQLLTALEWLAPEKVATLRRLLALRGISG